MKLHNPIQECRICGSSDLSEIFDFINPSFSGIFQKDGASVPKAPLVLTQCSRCFLVQLAHNYEPGFLYGDSYGYESGLNAQMVGHLTSTARKLEGLYLHSEGVMKVLDIASNDGTLLSGYVSKNLQLFGIDPLIGKLSNRYPEGSIKISSFFSAEAFEDTSEQKMDLVTSLSVIYDLANPTKFFSDVYSVLKENGIWYFEQSYLPSMVNTNGYDTICHEHLLYLTLSNIKYLLEISGLKLLDAELNDVNGGSIAVTAIKSGALVEVSARARHLLENERVEGYLSSDAMSGFKKSILVHNERLKSVILEHKLAGKHIIGLGASTKGNITLHLLGDAAESIEFIGEINSRKFNLETPGTAIAIISQDAALSRYEQKKVLLIILPWHFKSTFRNVLREFEAGGGTILWPFPEISLGLDA